MKAFDLAWSIIKALPRESLYTERDETRPGRNNQGGYGQMPFRYITQTRHKTMHPAIQGLLDRTQSSITYDRGNINRELDKRAPDEELGVHPGRIDVYDTHPRQPTILDVPTLNLTERTQGTSTYHMMGRPDNDPDIASFSRIGSMDDPDADLRRTKDFARLDALESEKERLADTLNLKDMSGTLEFIPRNRAFGEV